MTEWLWHLMDSWERSLTMDFKEAGDDPNFPPPPPKISFGPPKEPWAWVGPALWVGAIVILSFVVWVMAR